VGDQYQSGTQIPVEVGHELDDRGSRACIQIAGGLIGEQDLGPATETPGEGNALLLTSGELYRIVMFPPGQAYPGQQVSSARGDIGLTPQLERYLHIFLRGEGRHQLKGLKHETDLFGSEPGSFILAQRVQLLAIEVHRAAGGLIQSGKQSQQRRLAAAGGPEYR
jgi:hypothetical protein